MSPYAYKFVPSGNNIQTPPKETFIEDFQQNVNEYFYESSDWFTIREETFLASGEYQNIDARVNGLINPSTGDNVEDDYKKLSFKNIEHSVDLGKYYYFNDNYWITVNVDKVKTLAQTVIVKRCNNTLRWIGDDGGYYTVPCSLGYLMIENRDYSTAGSAVVTPSGLEQCIVQYNENTNKIRPNQRFLLGNPGHWTAFRVEGGGLNNFNNQKTMDNATPGFIRITLSVDYTGISTGSDDLTNGIANAFENIYTLSINQSSISGDSSQTVQLIATVKKGDEIVSRSVNWETDDVLVATVDENGLVTFVSTGVCIIRCSLANNDLVNDTCDVIVTSSPVNDYQLRISPSSNYIFEEEEVEFSVYLYENDVQQSDVVLFSLNPNTVPDTNYIYQVTGDNTFTIHNYERYLQDYLEVTATSGSNTLIVQIYLRGTW